MNKIKPYSAYIKAKQIKGLSVPSVIVDYKTGRSVELLSQAEKYIWYLLRFDDDVLTIYEQYPLDLNLTVLLAKQHSIKHPKNNSTPMTTDFYVETRHGFVAYSVKSSKKVLNKPRNVEKLFLEKLYWDSLGIEFHIVFGEELNMTYIRNIMDVVTCYNEANVFSKFDKIRHQIAHKKLQIDIKKEPIDYIELLQEKVYEK